MEARPSEEGREEEEVERGPSETFVVSTRVSMPVRDSIDGVVDSGLYLRVSDYLRDAIRRDLDSRELGKEEEKEKEKEKEEEEEV